MKNAQKRLGFTLIEMILTLTLTLIIASVVVQLVAVPIMGYFDVNVRAQMVDIAQGALQKMTREIRGALPNSIRVKQLGNWVALELVPTLGVARYRTTGPGGANDVLDFAQADDQFSILGNFEDSVIANSGAGSAYRLVIYNTGDYGLSPDFPLPGINVYGGPSLGPIPPVGTHVVTPVGTTVTLIDNGDQDRVQLSAPFQFGLSSTEKRVFIVGPPVLYLCDQAQNTLVRYSGYPLQSVQPIDVSQAPLSGLTGHQAARMADRIATCDFNFQPGSAQRGGLVTLKIGIQGQGQEAIHLIKQVHVNNAP